MVVRAGRTWAAAFSGAVLLAFATQVHATDYPALVRSLSAAVAAKYYDPHLHGADWPALTRRYEAEARSVRTDAAFETLADAMLAKLHSSHLYLQPPGVRTEGWRPAFKAREINGANVVSEVSDLSDARAKGVRTGEVVENWATLPGALGAQADVVLQGCTGAARTVSARREGVFWPPPEPGFRWRRLRTGPHTTLGYMRVDAFDDDGAELADKAMADLGDTDGLVIDLRGNHGGNASAVRLASYFVPRGPSVILLGRDYLESLNHSPTAADALAAPEVERTYTTAKVWETLQAHKGAIAIWSEDVGAKRYGKPVVVLIGPETASAAEGFGWIMRLKSRASFVGETTAGALLSAESTDIGQGWSVTIPEAGIWAPDGADYGDRAITPQIVVPVTRADLCAGRDRQLEVALRLAGGPADQAGPAPSR